MSRLDDRVIRFIFEVTGNKALAESAQALSDSAKVSYAEAIDLIRGAGYTYTADAFASTQSAALSMGSTEPRLRERTTTTIKSPDGMESVTVVETFE